VDFYRISRKEVKGDLPSLFPDFLVKRSKDLMVRGKHFLAVWNPKTGLWSTDEYDVREMVDDHLEAYAKDLMDRTGEAYNVNYLSSNSNKGWREFKNYLQILGDNSHDLDTTLTFADTEVKKEDYVTKRLPYSLAPGDHSAWDELVGTLYPVEERAKIEWIIGAIVSGDSKKIDKFAVFYGDPGTGKGTILAIIRKLFPGYTTTFNAKDLGASGKDFAAEVFKDNPLIAIQDDGDLSRIEDNSKLNMIVSHEPFPMNEKYKAPRSMVLNSFLLMGTNQPVKITDAKSGLLRRLIDISPTGVRIPRAHYDALMTRIDFERGAIAHHCLEVYRKMGKNYYNNYRPMQMMFQTDVTFNFVESYYDVFKSQGGVSLKQAYELYKEYCNETGIPINRQLPQYKLREELKNYFESYHDRHRGEDGVEVRNWFYGFNASKFKAPTADDTTFSLVIDQEESIFDELAKEWPAQEATANGTPKRRWVEVTTTLSDLDTHELHFVRVPENHIVIDFDLRDPSGEKSLELNLQAASNWPPTYAELSKGGAGVHLHYTYDGNVSELASLYSEGIEVKTLLGEASLRRRLTRCNNVPVATISGGLPKKEKKLLSPTLIKDEKHLRTMIENNLQKKHHPSTKSSMDFIKHLLDEAYNNGVVYDVSDMQSRLVAFAVRSTNQKDYCLSLIPDMKLQGAYDKDAVDAEIKKIEEYANTGGSEDSIAIFDIEVYPNLFVVCWKYLDSPRVQKLINPDAREIEALLKLKLVGFNNRRYDNHILYARWMGATIEQLYIRSQKIIRGDRDAFFAQAYGLSYADIYDFSSVKKTVKKWEIDLGIKHSELDLPWDQPVAEKDVLKVVDYCVDDVLGTEATFKALKADFIARQILAEISGLTVNHTTARHTERIIFGNDKNPQDKFVYTKLAEEPDPTTGMMFPGYKYDMGKSTYKGEITGEGGLVRAKEGMYTNVAVLDIESMHPTTIEVLNLFGPYTKNFSALKAARVAIKNGHYDAAREMLGGKLKPFLENTDDKQMLKALSDALKIVINSVYGLTSAKFDNAFRDMRNVDNIVAKRGALFMIDLMEYCDMEGIEWIHIKTDSIKVVNASTADIEKIKEFGKKYGYTFVHESTYDRFCLVNDAVYIARKDVFGYPVPIDPEKGVWEAVGKQFQHPYVFKTLFSHEDITFDDLGETKQVREGAMYLDFKHDRPPKDEKEFSTDDLAFVGRIGKFVPVQEGCGGAILWVVRDGKPYAVAGTKGRLWMEADMAKSRGEEVEIDISYYEGLVDAAVKQIEKFGSFEEFVS
jgi:hypothetical protein